MTLSSYAIHQTPTESSILRQATRLCSEGQPFSALDFRDRSSGTVRNTFSSLVRKGLIERYNRSSVAFYWVASVPRPATIVTPTHRVDTTDLVRLLRDIRMGERAVHDIRLRTQ